MDGSIGQCQGSRYGDALLQGSDLIERLRMLPADARSIYRPRRPRPGLAQQFEIHEQTRKLRLKFDEGGGCRAQNGRLSPMGKFRFVFSANHSAISLKNMVGATRIELVTSSV